MGEDKHLESAHDQKKTGQASSNPEATGSIENLHEKAADMIDESEC
jgi:hypothetical protein